MTGPGSSRADVELTEPWAEPVYRAGPAIPARPSASRGTPAGAMSPPHGIQAFSAVPLPASQRVVEPMAAPRSGVLGSRNARLLGAALFAAVLLLSAIGFGVHVAWRSEPAAAPAPSRLEAIQRGLAKQRAANRPTPTEVRAPASTTAPTAAVSRPAAHPRAAPAAKPARLQAAAQPQPTASSKPGPQPRPSKFADEPADPD